MSVEFFCASPGSVRAIANLGFIRGNFTEHDLPKRANFFLIFAGCAAPKGVHSGWTLVPPGDRACRGTAVPGSPGEPRVRTPHPTPDPPRPATPGTTRGGQGGGGEGGVGGGNTYSPLPARGGGVGGYPPKMGPKMRPQKTVHLREIRQKRVVFPGGLFFKRKFRGKTGDTELHGV